MSNLQYKTVITARDRGDILVERLCENKLVERYTTSDLSEPRNHFKQWMVPIIIAANTEPQPDPGIETARIAALLKKRQLETEIRNCQRILDSTPAPQCAKGLIWNIDRLQKELNEQIT